MRTKRSKKYRKLMHQYETAFGFREPYQVLVDSHFLKAVYGFKMDLIPALERTLQGKVKPFLTKCSLAAMMAAESVPPPPSSSSGTQSRPIYQRRPPQLPPPTILPLRYCSHNEDDTPIDEASCLLSLLSPNAELKKNKEHYILASADPPEPPATNDRRKSFTKPSPKYNLRRDARTIPGVPIIYVKRSVMILEPMSGSSEGVRDGIERSKFKTGLMSTAPATKRKRDDEEGDAQPKAKKAKKAKGVNPLSVKKPKKRETPVEKKGSVQEISPKEVRSGKERDESKQEMTEEGVGVPSKTRRKRRHKPKTHLEGETKPDVSLPVET